MCNSEAARNVVYERWLVGISVEMIGENESGNDFTRINLRVAVRRFPDVVGISDVVEALRHLGQITKCHSARLQLREYFEHKVGGEIVH